MEASRPGPKANRGHFGFYLTTFFLVLIASIPVVAAEATDPERQVTKTGTVDLVFIDDFAHRESRVDFVLLGAAGQRTRLDFGFDPGLAVGTRLEVRGVERDGSLVPLSFAVLDSPPAEPGRNTNLGEQGTLVLLVNSYQNPEQPATVEAMRYRTFAADNPYSVDNYFTEVSFGKTWLTGQVFGWYTLPLAAPVFCTDYYGLIDAAIDAADAEVYFPDYSRLLIVFPEAGCWWQGMGNLSLVWFETDDGDVQMSWSLYNAVLTFGGTPEWGGTSYHEMGHNFGCRHANDWECDRWTIGDECESIKYGDSFDAMGMAGAKGHYNAIHKEVVGWFDPGQVLQANGPGRYGIEPIETVTAGPKALKIPVPGGHPYYVEYRRPIGFDAYLSETYATDHDGAVVHLDYFVNTGDSQLLDMTPHGPPSQFWDSLFVVLSEGEMFRDEESGVAIATLSVTEEHLAVCIAEAGCAVSPTVFTFPVRAADRNTLSWGGDQDVRFVRGSLEGVATYTIFDSGDLNQAHQLDISSDHPESGDGTWYLVRSRCCGLWQTSLGAEAEREVILP